MLRNLTGWHAIIVLAVILLVFGASKLPALARGVGQSVRILRAEVADPDPDGGAGPARSPAEREAEPS